VVTNALRLRSFKRPASAEEILHPPLRTRIADAGYLVAIGLLALAISAGALWPSEGSGMGVTAHEPTQEAPAEPNHDDMPGM
jgi:Cu+-exporting ATPase